MPESKYRLEAVRDVREQAQADAARELAARRAQLAEAETELARRLHAIDECRLRRAASQREMMERAQAGAEARHLVARRAHIADLRRTEEELIVLAEQQRALVERHAAEVDDATGRLIERAKELQVIEKHRENWRRGEAREGERREQKINDEVGALRHTHHTRRT